jgi:trk system potassium uptake protein
VEPGRAPVLEALFTSTSAVTVTGLTVVDTATHWTPLGQALILGLIQIGGLGIVTSASLLFLFVSRRMGLLGRLATQAETHRGIELGQVRRLVAAVIAFTLAVEAIAAAVLTLRLWIGGGRSATSALWEGGFHAISAFNNAGFSLYSDSLAGFASDGWIVLTVALAVIAGGLGFPVWIELRRQPREPRRWSLHTKLTLATTAALLAFGTVLITALEWGNAETLGAQGVGGRLLGGFFASVTPRSSGFSTVDYGAMGGETLLVNDLLMFVGGGSGGTAAGIKVTTFAILFLVVWAELRGDREIVAFGRSIPVGARRQALTISVVAVSVVFLATLVLMATNDLNLEVALFECLSAFTTTGLSTGITPDLDGFGQALLMPLMLAGRIGPLTLGVALVLRERERLYSHPEERPLVG